MQTPAFISAIASRVSDALGRLSRIESRTTFSTNFTPENLIAGTAPLDRRSDAATAAYYQAVAALDTERVRLIYAASADGRFVHYLAAPAASFASAGEVTSPPLAESIPGVGQSEGDGAWFGTDSAGHTVVIVRRDEKMASYSGRPERAARFAGELTVVRPDLLQSYPRWEGRHEAETRLPRRILVIAALIQGAVAIALLLSATALFLPSSRHNDEISAMIAKVRAQDDEAVLRVLGLKSNLAALQELERLAGFKAKNSGRIVNFKAESGTIEWSFLAPATLGRAQIADLGEVSVTEEGLQLRIERRGNGK